MIALIPGLTDTLAYLRPQQPPAPAYEEGFARLLASAAEAVPTSASAKPPAPPAMWCNRETTLPVSPKSWATPTPMSWPGPTVLKIPTICR